MSLTTGITFSESAILARIQRVLKNFYGDTVVLSVSMVLPGASKNDARRKFVIHPKGDGETEYLVFDIKDGLIRMSRDRPDIKISLAFSKKRSPLKTFRRYKSMLLQLVVYDLWVDTDSVTK